jgi:hypothetical protein
MSDSYYASLPVPLKRIAEIFGQIDKEMLISVLCLDNAAIVGDKMQRGVLL